MKICTKHCAIYRLFIQCESTRNFQLIVKKYRHFTCHFPFTFSREKFSTKCMHFSQFPLKFKNSLKVITKIFAFVVCYKNMSAYKSAKSWSTDFQGISHGAGRVFHRMVSSHSVGLDLFTPLFIGADGNGSFRSIHIQLDTCQIFSGSGSRAIDTINAHIVILVDSFSQTIAKDDLNIRCFFYNAFSSFIKVRTLK